MRRGLMLLEPVRWCHLDRLGQARHLDHLGRARRHGRQALQGLLRALPGQRLAPRPWPARG
jgi:hypothetical protein